MRYASIGHWKPATCQLLVVAASLLAPAPAIAATACPGADAPPTSAAAAATADTIICVLDEVRSRHGRRPWRDDVDLTRAASGLAVAMVRDAFFDHVTPHGTTPLRRAVRNGYGRRSRTLSVAELIGWGEADAGTPEAMVRAWMGSPEHRRILLARGYRDVGVGVASGAPVQPVPAATAATYAVDVGAASG